MNDTVRSHRMNSSINSTRPKSTPHQSRHMFSPSPTAPSITTTRKVRQVKAYRLKASPIIAPKPHKIFATCEDDEVASFTVQSSSSTISTDLDDASIEEEIIHTQRKEDDFHISAPSFFAESDDDSIVTEELLPSSTLTTGLGRISWATSMRARSACADDSDEEDGNQYKKRFSSPEPKVTPIEDQKLELNIHVKKQKMLQTTQTQLKKLSSMKSQMENIRAQCRRDLPMLRKQIIEVVTMMTNHFDGGRKAKH